MILLFHIAIASISVFYSIYLFFKPSFSGLKVSYACITLTIISGTYLVLTKPAHITQTCVEGLVYIAAMLVGIILVNHKLSKNDRHSLV